MTARRREGAARAAVVALAPVVVLVAHVSHPYIAVLPDAHAIADAVHTSTMRWAVVHLLTAVGVALVALAFLAVRAHLRDAGEDRFSTWGLPLVLFGSAVYGLLPGLEFAPLAAAKTGGDVAAAQEALQPVFAAVLVTGAVIFAAGVLAFAKAIADSRILDRRTTWIVVTALAVLALSRATPLGVVQFHVQALASLLALWPLARVMWRSDDDVAAARPSQTARSLSTPSPPTTRAQTPAQPSHRWSPAGGRRGRVLRDPTALTTVKAVPVITQRSAVP